MSSFNPRQLFQYISYLQYPLLVVGLGYLVYTMVSILPELRALGDREDEGLSLLMNAMASGVNTSLMFIGISMSFSTLQDPRKTQNKLSLQVWSDPKKGKAMLFMMAITSISLILFSMTALLLFPDSVLAELSFGILTLGIAYMGVLRVAIDMFEHHRIDRKGAI